MTLPVPGPAGPKAVSGQMVSGQIVLTLNDGTTYPAPVLMIKGSLVDNGDGTWSINLL